MGYSVSMITISMKFRFEKKPKKISYISCALLLIIILNLFFSIEISTRSSNKFNRGIDDFDDDKTRELAASDNTLFQGIENPINITDSGNLYTYNQEIALNNQEPLNLTYYLDDVHNWKASSITESISNIHDTKDWINNSEFFPITAYKVNQVVQNTPHNYTNNINWLTSIQTITRSGALAMRAHFVNISFQENHDFIRVLDGTNNLIMRFFDTGFRKNFLTPWIKGNSLRIDMETDASVRDYGYYIDYYEFVNSSSNYYINNNTWGYNSKTSIGNYRSAGRINNSDAMCLELFSQLYTDTVNYYSQYPKNNFTEIYQNLTIPRGKVIDAYIEFDYNPEFCMDTNSLFIYAAINNKKIYSIYFGDIVAGGLRNWYSTNKIYMDLWVNTSNIFEGDLISQDLNFSIGIKSSSSSYYSGYEDGFQQEIWFDNITFGITSIANSSQNDINLTINEYVLIEGGCWGESSLQINGNWQEHPIILTMNASSTSLDFNLNTTIYGFHNATSKINQQGLEGVNYQILENGTIYWTFYHNFYMPSQYADFEFVVYKPSKWKFLSVSDPTLQVRSFEKGNIGDSYLKINKTNALYPGWWKFLAVSPNYLYINNTKLYQGGQWVHSTFKSGESTRIKTQVNYSNEIPTNLGSSLVNLTIYDPKGDLWYQEGKPPLSNGSVVFSEVFFDSLNTIGGQYNYTLFWTNGTALGGLKSNFLIIHNCSIVLMKPSDAVEDLIAEAFLGDILPLRIALYDSENNNSISNAIITYNWTSSLNYTEEAALGIYEAILDTADLITNGYYNIFINSSMRGYTNSNLTLELRLSKETNLQRLESSSTIEMHSNGSIRFRYYTDIDSVGIMNAEVEVNISNPDLYYVQGQLGGYYIIEFNTSFINDLGIYELVFNFSAYALEPQTHVYQFEIVEQSVNITVYLNNNKMIKNGLEEAMFMEKINVSVRISAETDKIYLSGGIVTWITENYEKSLTPTAGAWYNTTIELSAANYTPGLNFIYLKFEQPKYKTETFGFQLLLTEQGVNLTVYINSQQIVEHTVLELMFKETINISARAMGLSEHLYLSGGVITIIGESYQQNLTEETDFWFNRSLVISAAYFESGINNVYLQFQQQNYTTSTFSFQLLISEQTVNLSILINGVVRPENYLIEVEYNDIFSIEANAFATAEKIYLSNGTMKFVVGTTEYNITENQINNYTASITVSTTHFLLGLNYVYVQFQRGNYTTTRFSFQMMVNQMSIDVETIDFEDSIEAYIGEEITIDLKLKGAKAGEDIEGATISYSWDFGVGTFEENSDGKYALDVKLPENVKGTYKITLIISKEGSVYKTKEFSFLIVISEKEGPSLLIWVILSVLIAVIGVLGALSLRTYVLLPRKRNKESILLMKTQRFKDLRNIQGIVVVHKISGIPIYSKNYSILESQKKELFSGFIQAITIIGEEISGERTPIIKDKGSTIGVEEKIIELDFNKFHCLIVDHDDLRCVLILKEKPSDRLKEQVGNFSLALCLQLSEQLEHWDGSLNVFETKIPEIMKGYLELYYKEPFKFADPATVAQIKKEGPLSSMETRIINVIYSFAKGKTGFLLNTILELVSEENKNFVIEGIESLIQRGVLKPVQKDKEKENLKEIENEKSNN